MSQILKKLKFDSLRQKRTPEITERKKRSASLRNLGKDFVQEDLLDKLQLGKTDQKRLKQGKSNENIL